MEIKKKDFLNKVYFSKDNSFLWRNLDNGFKTKWCGIWNGNIKFFEYFAYKINETWLTPDLCEKTNIYTTKTIHTYKEKEKNIKVKENIYPWKNNILSILSIENKENKERKIKIELECAVNIRDKGENWHLRTYKSSKNDLRKCVLAESYLEAKKYYAIYGCGTAKTILNSTESSPKKTKIHISLKEIYKDHYPNSKQRCFLSSSYVVELTLNPMEKVQIPFIFSPVKEQNDVFKEYDDSASKWLENRENWIAHQEKQLRAKIATPDKQINEAFIMAQHSLTSMMYKADFGTGLYAGLPWFLAFWSRDTFWSLLGLNDLGFHEDSKDIMSTIASFYNETKDKTLFSYGINGIPTKIDLNKTALYYSCDVNPLFLTAYMHYYRGGGEKTQLLNIAEGKIKNNLRLMDYIVDSNTAKNQQKVEHTWMDSIIRNGTPVEVQALWTEALKENKSLFKKMRNQLNTTFYNKKEDYLYDIYNSETKEANGKIRPNALVALMFNLIDKEKAQKTLNAVKNKLHGKYGIRTLSKDDINYASSNYHNGSSWGLTSMWGVCAYLNYDYKDDALDLLEKISMQGLNGNPYGFDECNDSSTGQSLGASPQSWSAGLFIYAIDSCLFGIKAGERNIIEINPKLPSKWPYAARLEKKIKKSVFDIKLLRRTRKDVDFLQIDLTFKEGVEKNLIKIMHPRNEMDVINGVIKESNKTYTIIEPEKKTIIIIKE